MSYLEKVLLYDANGLPLVRDTNGSMPVNSRMVDELGAPFGNKQLQNRQRVVSTDYLDAIGQGDVLDHNSFYKFGNTLAGTTQISVWEEGTLYPWDGIDTAPGIVTISSTSANDVNTIGTGAWTAEILGLNSSTGLDQAETLNLNGQTAVSSTLSYSRLFRVQVKSAGASKANEGIIRVGTGAVAVGVPAVTWANVPIGENQTLQCIWTVPTGYVFNMKTAEFSINGTKGAEGRIYSRNVGEMFQIKDVFHGSGGSEEHRYDLIRQFQSGTDIDFRVTGGQSGTDIEAHFQGWYELA